MMRGFVTVIVGPMFSEKSGELIRRCQKLMQYGRKRVQAYKPAEDNRFGKEDIVSRIGYRFQATSISRKLTAETVEAIIADTQDVDIVAFDEAQFFTQPIVELIEELASRGKGVIVAGLNTDYRGKPFGHIGDLLAIADEIVKLTAFCATCGDPGATFTQRTINGQPAAIGPLILIGDTESYEPRCRFCYVPPHLAAQERASSIQDAAELLTEQHA